MKITRVFFLRTEGEKTHNKITETKIKKNYKTKNKLNLLKKKLSKYYWKKILNVLKDKNKSQKYYRTMSQLMLKDYIKISLEN